EIRIRRIVFVEAAYRRIAEENASASIGLQSMLVRIDDHGVCLRNCVVSVAYLFVEMRDKGEVAAVGGIDMHSSTIAPGERQNLVKWIDSAAGRGSKRYYDGCNVADTESGFERSEVHASAGVDSQSL